MTIGSFAFSLRLSVRHRQVQRGARRNRRAVRAADRVVDRRRDVIADRVGVRADLRIRVRGQASCRPRSIRPRRRRSNRDCSPRSDSSSPCCRSPSSTGAGLLGGAGRSAGRFVRPVCAGRFVRAGGLLTAAFGFGAAARRRRNVLQLRLCRAVAVREREIAIERRIGLRAPCCPPLLSALLHAASMRGSDDARMLQERRVYFNMGNPPGVS